MRVMIELPWRNRAAKKFAKEHNLEFPVDTNEKQQFDLVIVNVDPTRQGMLQELFSILQELSHTLYAGLRFREARGLFEQRNKIDWVIEEKDIYFD